MQEFKKRKECPIEAVQWFPDKVVDIKDAHGQSRLEYPLDRDVRLFYGYYEKLRKEGKSDTDEDFEFSEKDFLPENVAILYSIRHEKIHPGDWIVKRYDDDGSFGYISMDPLEFAKLYEAIEK